MTEGFFLPEIFAAISAQNSKIPLALYGPCEYWNAWYQSLSDEKKLLHYPYHQPLASTLSIKTLVERNYLLTVTLTPINLLSRRLSEFEEPAALWHYDSQKRVLFVTLNIYPLNLLTLDNWLTLYSISNNLAKTLFLDKESTIYLEPIETGNMATKHFLSLKSFIQIASSFELSPISVVLMEPLSFQTFLICLKEIKPTIRKSQFNWFQKKEAAKMPPLQGIAQKRSVYAYAGISEADEVLPVIEWAFAAGSLMASI